MRKIQMVDLATQYQHLKAEIDQAMLAVLESCAFINGPEVKQFQQELEAYLGIKHVIPCANGTDALQIAMMAYDFQPGDEVITANFTYVATAEVMALLKLRPVLVDVHSDYFTLDPDQVRKAITPRTKAIVPVHLFGQSADMKPILEIAREHNLAVIEDVAQAIGADYTGFSPPAKVGTIGNVGCTSFFPSKNLGCYGDGGAIFTNDDELAAKMRMIANHGQSRLYYHDSVGVNSRLDSLQAAVLRIKLRHLNDFNEKRNIVAAFYNKHFAKQPKLIIPKTAPYSTHVFHQYTLQVVGADRWKLKEFLGKKDIPSMVYYPVPLHLQQAYQDSRYKVGDFPVTERLCEVVLSLPISTEMDTEQLTYITDAVNEFLS